MTDLNAVQLRYMRRADDHPAGLAERPTGGAGHFWDMMMRKLVDAGLMKEHPMGYQLTKVGRELARR